MNVSGSHIFNRITTGFFTWLVVAGLAASVFADETIVVLPTEIQLNGPMARQRLLVERAVDGQLVGQLTDDVQYVSSAPEIVR
ncbi:MAG: hypothetical protein ACKVT0_21305, partial [Planctomycetaceae bacterium]